MKRRIIGFALVVVMATALLLSCVPEFEHPISREGKTLDKELLGKWENKTNGETMDVNFIGKKDGLFDVNTSGTSKNGQIVEETTQFKGYSTDVNGLKFICIQDANGNGNYTISNYKIMQDNCYVRGFSEDKIKTLIEDGKLKGVIPKSSNENVKVTSSGEELRQVIAQEGLSAFCDMNDPNKVLLFTRVKKK
jgi:hypothetical protein